MNTTNDAAILRNIYHYSTNNEEKIIKRIKTETEFTSPIILQTTAKNLIGIEWITVDSKFKSLYAKQNDITRQIYLRLESMTLTNIHDSNFHANASTYLYCSDTIDKRFCPVGDGCLSNINHFLHNIDSKYTLPDYYKKNVVLCVRHKDVDSSTLPYINKNGHQDTMLTNRFFSSTQESVGKRFEFIVQPLVYENCNDVFLKVVAAKELHLESINTDNKAINNVLMKSFVHIKLWNIVKHWRMFATRHKNYRLKHLIPVALSLRYAPDPFTMNNGEVIYSKKFLEGMKRFNKEKKIN